jgi:hypothetical protein
MTFIFLNQPEIIDANEVAKQFCDIYYTGMSLHGLSQLLYLFDQNANCMHNGHKYNNIYNVLSSLSASHIEKIHYEKLIYSSSIIDKHLLLINVSGLCNGITFWKQFTTVHAFSESFVLKIDENKRIFVHNYIFNLV